MILPRAEIPRCAFSQVPQLSGGEGKMTNEIKGIVSGPIPLSRQEETRLRAPAEELALAGDMDS